MAKRSKKGSLTVAGSGKKVDKKQKATNNGFKNKNKDSNLKEKVKNKKMKPVEDSDEEVLLRDVLDLGGDKSDLKLIAGKKKKNQQKDDLDKSEFDDYFNKLGFKDIPQEEKTFSALGNTAPKKPVIEEKNIQSESTETQILELSRNVKIQYLPKRCLVKEPYLWHDTFANDPKNDGLDGKSREASWLYELALKYYKNEVEVFEETGKKGTNRAWMQTVISAGTLPDKVAALSLTLKKSPVHYLSSFESLLTISKKKEKRVSFLGLEAIKELLMNDLLPDWRRLRNFHAQPLKSLARALVGKDEAGDWSHENCKIRLILWAFEDELKKLVASFVERIRELSYDCLEVSKKKAMKFALDLLTTKPEQEKTFLTLVVDKLGDPKFKISSKALHMLNRLITDHPLMQATVVQEVRDLLFRPNLSQRSQYYCICFLNSQVLSDDRKEVAQKLVKIYMSFFKACTKKKINSDDKMLSALLTGVSRAFPFADMAEKDIIEEIDLLFKTVHVTNLNTTTRALVLLFQVFSVREEVSDRFYNALYASLLHAELPRSTARHPMFLNLVYRAVKADPCDPRVQAIIKRLLQTTSLQLPPFTAASLVLVHELLKLRPALAYRLFSTAHSHAVTNDAGTSNLKNVDIDAIMGKLGSDDEDEHFVDIRGDSDAEEGDKEEEKRKLIEGAWVHHHNVGMRNKKTKDKTTEKPSTGEAAYDPFHRNPQYASAECCSVWELCALKRHYHPTVQKYAQVILNKDEDSSDLCSGDPLDDFTLIKFLDRFVFRNPKTSAKKMEASAQRTSVHQRKRKSKFSDQSELPVNTAEFLEKTNLQPEEVFFHKYFSSLASINSKRFQRKTKDGDDDDLDSVTDEEFAQFIASDAGQRQVDHVLNYSEHVYKNKKETGLDDEDFDLSDDDDDDDDDDDVDFDEDDVDGELKDPATFDEEVDDDDFGDDEIMGVGGSFEDEDEPKAKKSKISSKSATKKKKSSAKDRSKNDDHITEEFDEMLTSNIRDKFDTIGSNAVVNRPKSSNKQMKWEKKMEDRDVIAAKRQHQNRMKKGKKSRGGRK